MRTHPWPCHFFIIFLHFWVYFDVFHAGISRYLRKWFQNYLYWKSTPTSAEKLRSIGCQLCLSIVLYLWGSKTAAGNRFEVVILAAMGQYIFLTSVFGISLFSLLVLSLLLFFLDIWRNFFFFHFFFLIFIYLFIYFILFCFIVFTFIFFMNSNGAPYYKVVSSGKFIWWKNYTCDICHKHLEMKSF